MKITNRVHAITRVPTDRNERQEQAWTDYQFVWTMRRLGFDGPELRRINDRATRIISEDGT